MRTSVIYELSTICLKPRVLPDVEKRFEQEYNAADRPVELVGSFHTEIGPLNQIVQIWRFEDMSQRDRFNGGQDNLVQRWLTAVSGSVLTATSELMRPVALSRELKAGMLGPYFELRQYTYPPGTLDRMMNAWTRAMPMRDVLGSPVAAIWSSDSGIVNSLTHLWPYPSLQERERIRKEVRKSGMWPPYKLEEAEGGAGYEILSQVNKLMLPAAFSPLQ